MLKQFKIMNGKMAGCEKEDGEIFIYTNPTKSEIAELIENYKIDEHTLNSALDPDENSRLEFEPEHIAMILKRPKNYSTEDNLLFKVISIGIFIFKTRLILVMSDDIQILEGKQTFKLQTLNDVLLKLIYGSISHFLGHLKVINMMSDSIEQKINSSMENKYLLNMFTLEKSLVYYLNGISSNTMLFEKMKINATKIGFTVENMELLDDIIIENNQCRSQAEIYSNILTGLMDARGSIVNNNLNILIKRLTIISIVFMPLNVIAGMGGMSEFSMMTQGIPWPVTYSLFTVGLVVVAFITYLIIRNMGFEKKNKKGKK
jgi:magnesium transporter